MPTKPLSPAQTIRLQRLLASLTDELAAWQDLAEGRVPAGVDGPLSPAEAKRFAPHRSQLRHLNGFFAGIVERLQADIAAAVPLAQTADRILQAQAIWAWFRAKLLLRYSPALAPWLFAADELAWACLRPLTEVRAAAVAAAGGAGPEPGAGAGADATLAALLKIPPLLYLGREVSPFVYPRDWALTSQVAGVSDPAWQALLQRAPFALIGMPWYETAHLAGTLVLAHEIGHVVDLDLGLSGELDQALAATAIPDAHRATWQHWRVEAFADLFGAAAGGLGFCRALADFLQQDGADLAVEPIDASRPYSYPTRYLRVLLVLEVLRRADGSLPTGAGTLLADWQARHGTAHVGMVLVADLPLVVAALLDQPLAALGGQSIRKLLGDVTAFDQVAGSLADKLLKGIQPAAADPRALFAAATLAFAKDPAGYQSRAIDTRLLTLIRKVADDKPRAALKAAEADLALSRAAGAGLADLLGGDR